MAPRRVTSPRPAASCSRISVPGDARRSHAAVSPHSTLKIQPVVRIVQVQTPQIFEADVDSFRDVVHRLTGYQATITCRQGAANRRDARLFTFDVGGLPDAPTLSSPPSSPSSLSYSSSSSPSLSTPSSDSSRTIFSEHYHRHSGFPYKPWRSVACVHAVKAEPLTDDDYISSQNGMDGIFSDLDPLTALDNMI